MHGVGIDGTPAVIAAELSLSEQCGGALWWHNVGNRCLECSRTASGDGHGGGIKGGDGSALITRDPFNAIAIELPPSFLKELLFGEGVFVV